MTGYINLIIRDWKVVLNLVWPLCLLPAPHLGMLNCLVSLTGAIISLKCWSVILLDADVDFNFCKAENFFKCLLKHPDSQSNWLCDYCWRSATTLSLFFPWCSLLQDNKSHKWIFTKKWRELFISLDKKQNSRKYRVQPIFPGCVEVA